MDVKQSIKDAIEHHKGWIHYLEKQLQEFEAFETGKSTVRKWTGKHIGDLIMEAMVDAKPDDRFTVADLGSLVDCPTERIHQGVKYLMDHKLMKDLTPQKARHKEYGLTRKALADLGIAVSPTPPKPKPKPKVKAKGKYLSMPKGKQAKRGSRQAEMMNYLEQTQFFTIKNMADTFNISATHARVTLDTLNKKKTDGPLFETHNKGPKGFTYRSLIFKGPRASDSRETRIKVGDKVETGRNRHDSSSNRPYTP